MLRLRWGALVGLGMVLLCASTQAATQPNVLLIVSEDNGPELGCYGDPYARTPNLDRLAGEGLRFTRAFVPQAGCSQSRASFLTGLYPHQHGQIGLATWGFRLYREDTPNLARNLKAAGYRTGIIGKLHINPASAFPFDYEAVSAANFGRKDLGQYARHAAEFMAAGDGPFFLSVNYPDAHDPWVRQVDGLPREPQTGKDVKAMPYLGIDPPGMREMVADYYNSLARLDALIGDLLAALERSGKAGDTIVVYIGDHGADMLRGKRTCYEGGLRIPLLIRWPGRMTPGVRNELVSTVDLVPTLLTAAGVAPAPALPGRPLQPLFAGSDAGWRTHVFAEYHTHGAQNYFPQRSVRSERFKLIENLLPDEVNPDFELTLGKLAKEAKARGIPGGLDLAATIAAAAPEVRAAYAVMRQPPRYELYDLDADPHEFRNLATAPEHAATLRHLQDALAAWRQETLDPLLDPKKLMLLTDEVRTRAESRKSDNKNVPWKYPDYLPGDLPERRPSSAPDSPPAAARRPNVLMIVVDDMNDWVGCLGGHPDVRTPHIDRLASRGVLFTNAHTAAPVCNPSRVAALTGRRPSTTGIYGNETKWMEVLPAVPTIPQHFMAHGYHVAGGGKVNHHTPGFNRRSDWHEYFDQVFDSHYQDQLARGLDVTRFAWPNGFPLNRLGAVRTFSRPPQNPNEFDWGAFDKSDGEMGDGRMVEWAVKFLARPPQEPFFLAAGIYRPHLPFYAPRKYFDMYPAGGIAEPPIKTDDCDDLPEAGQRMAAERRGDYELVMQEGRYQEVLQAYLASITFGDALVGRLLDALDASPAADNTIVVLWSDHGWHLGEKQHLHKFTLWERSTRIPLVVAGAGVAAAGARCARPVGTIDLFPTLADLGGLPGPAGLDGASLRPLLETPDRAWDRPALTTHGAGNHAVRSDRWRYIRYADGGEELYDHAADPHEWTNLAGRSEVDAVKRDLARWLPATDAPAAAAKKRKPKG